MDLKQLRGSLTKLSHFGFVLICFMVQNAFISNGQNPFDPQQVLKSSDAVFPGDTFPIDLNNDDLADILFSSTGDDKIGWYRNKGEGKFSEQNIISTTANDITKLFSVDLDGNETPDVIAYSEEDSTISWYANDGAGDFSSAKIITPNVSLARRLIGVDLDGDGDNDVLTNSLQNNTILWFENLGNGSFSDKKIITEEVEGVVALSVADFNEDGQTDIVTASSTTSLIGWIKNKGGAEFDSLTVIADESDLKGKRAYSVLPSDLDLDGDIDIVSGIGSIEGGVIWNENTGQGSFGETKSVFTPFHTIKYVKTIDIEGDGDIDVMANHRGFGVSLFTNNGESFSDFKELEIGNTGNLSSFSLFDLDGDKDLDVITSDLFSNTINWEENNGRGNFSKNTNVLNDPGVVGPEKILVEDLNGDTQSDIIVHTLDQNYLFWFNNNGSGSFSTIDTIKISPRISDLVAVTDDFNDNNTADLITTEFYKISIRRNNGSAMFGEATTLIQLEDNANIRKAVLEDIDGDNLTDLVVSAFIHQSDSRNRFIAFKNNGGEFTTNVIIDDLTDTFKNNFGDFELMDVDSDGDLDFVVGLGLIPTDSKIVFYENIDGSFEFGDQQVITNNITEPRNILASDVNGDSRIDIIVRQEGRESKLVWYQNLGANNFSEPITITEESSPNLLSKDINNDNMPDLLTSDKSQGIVWFRNNGEGFEQAEVIDSDDSGILAAEDLDKDSDLDVILGSRFHKIGWYENTITSTPIAFDEKQDVPAKFILKQNFPNPFNPFTTIEYGLPKATNVVLKVYDVLGQQVSTLFSGRQSAGNHSVSFDASHLSSGMYLYRLETDENVITRTMMLIK